MPFTRQVTIGAVALCNYGADSGKLYVISDVLDLNYALVDRPDEIRRKMNMKRLILTDLKVEMPRLAKKSVLAKAMADADVEAKFAASSWGQKLARREAKKNMTDFDRHCAAVKKMKRSASVRKAYNKLRKSA